MPTLRRVATTALLLFVAVTIGFIVGQEVSRGEAPSPDPSQSTTASVADEPAEGVVSATDGELQIDPAAENSGDEPQKEPADGESLNEGRDPDDIEAEAPATQCEVIAIYFHNTMRCRTCRKIEEEARASLEATFSEELAAGRLRWMAINMEDEPVYVTEYELVKPTLVLTRYVEDEREAWVSLDDTWGLIGREERFSQYIVDSTSQFLRGCP